MQNAIAIASRGELVLEETREGARVSTSFASLVERHARLVFRVALAIVRNPHDAEDVAQETFLQLFRGNKWDQIEDERGYLARVAWRLAVRRHRSRKRDQQLDRELPPQLASLQPNPEQSAMESELEAWLHASIDRLPEKLRQPLALSALGELKLVEIAGILGLPDGTVRRRIHTARQILRRQLEKRKG